MNENKNNPMHGIKLQQIVEDLEKQFGWEELDRRMKMNCFASNPSVKSTLKFLRQTPWAREKVEKLWLNDIKKDE
jgi:uncharacterized protein (DUF2132 family)